MDDSFRVGGFSLVHVLASFLTLGVLALIIYLLWNCSCKGDRTDPERQRLTPAAERIDTKSMYAIELEPGLVVLQSQDGEFFRILHEYDCAKNTPCHSGATRCSHPPLNGETVQYIPSYTRAHMQTHPSAPPVVPGDSLIAWDTPNPPPYQH